MNFSWKIGTFRGITLAIHWTFAILLLWLVLAHGIQGADVSTTVKGVLFMVGVFGCVLLHELGHALAAQRFGIGTRDITLYPIGGVARLERIPEEPIQELWIALAGPMVNVVIAAVIFAFTRVSIDGETFSNTENFIAGPFWKNLFMINVTMAVFNLLPAFPMDGGRVFRALLALNMDYVKATRIAAGVGQSLAILFAFLGLFNNFTLLFIAIFVYLGAAEEAQAVQMRSLFRGVVARDVMITQFQFVGPADSLSSVVTKLLAGTQQDFPVVENNEVVGMLTRRRLVEGLTQFGETGKVAEAMAKIPFSVVETDRVDRLLEKMSSEQAATVPVLRAGSLVGLLNLENVGEYVMVGSALRRFAPKSA